MINMFSKFATELMRWSVTLWLHPEDTWLYFIDWIICYRRSVKFSLSVCSGNHTLLQTLCFSYSFYIPWKKLVFTVQLCKPLKLPTTKTLSGHQFYHHFCSDSFEHLCVGCLSMLFWHRLCYIWPSMAQTNTSRAERPHAEQWIKSKLLQWYTVIHVLSCVCGDTLQEGKSQAFWQMRGI